MQSVKSLPFLASEKQAALSLAAIFALRMLGLFMIVPIFSLYAANFSHSTPLLIGIAMGCYGLTQACLQIPFGICSDRWGRKPIIAIGLLLFALGSLIAANSHSIWGIIIGRGLQGAGAVGGATSALLADLTRSEQRTKAMAIVGITIGLSFSAAMVLGPVVSAWVGISGIFWLSILFAVSGLYILWRIVPTSTNLAQTTTSIWPNLLASLQNYELLRLNFGILILHAILTASFIALPLMLQNSAGLAENHQWHIYLPTLLLAFISIYPLIKKSEKHLKSMLILAIITLGLAELLLWSFQSSVIGIAFGLWLFFTAFTLLEAILPSTVSKLAPLHCRGTALGINSSCQFFGIFLGGSIGGWLYGHYKITDILVVCIVLAIFWLLVVCRMAPYKKAAALIKTI